MNTQYSQEPFDGSSRLSRRQWGDHPALPVGQADAQILSDALLVRRTLIDLAVQEKDLALHLPDGEFIGTCLLKVGAGMRVSLRVRMLSERRDLSGLSCVHVTASTPVGLVLFVLADVVAKDFDVLEANWPRNMASVQGRRYERWRVQGTGDDVMLTLPHTSVVVDVCNLSEDGVAFNFESPAAPADDAFFDARLILPGQDLPISWLQAVHMRKAPDGLSWLVGARMLGMSRRARVTLREWLEGRQSYATRSSR